MSAPRWGLVVTDEAEVKEQASELALLISEANLKCYDLVASFILML